ncbi:DUF6157 family protein [Paenibacillus sp. YN15]|uniref:DUF6157 family protein n=1 Tax=Paenibacillus sp. YN15 TaxID=1742774 RepID=UPI000DCD93C9|nr:DUF6157 family protein [Paenibacillus sp. YN15]RAU97905.1 hypothetical protein DQG13_18150 [Paenibacillus sp. YN15]
MSYTNTFITVSPDCPVSSSVRPQPKGGAKTKPLLEYELLSAHPYCFTEKELIYQVHVRHQRVTEVELREREGEIRQKLFAKSHPCMRASMLPKKYGYGIHYDHEGKIAIYGMETSRYRAFAEGEEEGGRVIAAMRNKKSGGQ